MNIYRERFSAIGTDVVVLVTKANEVVIALEITKQQVDLVDQAASRFRGDSEISRLQENYGISTKVSPLLWELFDCASRAHSMTNGVIDVTVGSALCALGYDRDFSEANGGDPSYLGIPVDGFSRIERNDSDHSIRLNAGTTVDFGSIGKAYIADRAARLIGAQISGGVLVSVGGDIAVAGTPPQGGWKVLIADDQSVAPDSDGEVVVLFSGGIATSSTSVRKWLRQGEEAHHIIDPATGMPAKTPWKTVSVAARSCVEANTASTAAMIWGESAAQHLNEWGLPARLAAVNDDVITLNGWGQPRVA